MQEETALDELKNEPVAPVVEPKEEVKESGQDGVSHESAEDRAKEKEKAKRRLSDRNKDLTKYWRKEQRKNEELEQRLKKYEEANKIKEEPDVESYDDFNKFKQDNAKWQEQERQRIREEEREAIKQEDAQEKYEREIEEGKQAYLKSRAEIAKEDANFKNYEVEIDEVVSEFKAPEIQDIILSAKEIGPSVVKYLGNNQEELIEIASSTPSKRAFKMGRLVAKLEAKPTKKSSSAPSPVRSETGSAPRQPTQRSASKHVARKGETFAERAKRLNGR